MGRKRAISVEDWRHETAAHEAGHAVAYWAIGVLPYSVAIAEFPGDTLIDRRNRASTGWGLCEASFCSNPVPRDILSKLRERKLVKKMVKTIVRKLQLEAMCIFAGPVAEAQFRRRALSDVLKTTGKGDRKSARAAFRWITDKKKIRYQLERAAIDAACQLMSEYATSVTALAEELRHIRRVDSKRIDE